MRPRVLSYGMSSTTTASPGRSRSSRRSRTCAVTCGPLAPSPARPGRARSGRLDQPAPEHRRRPASCIHGALRHARPPGVRVGLGQDPRTVLGDRHRQLEVRGQAAVRGHRRPAVVQHPHLGPAHVHHRLDGQAHARHQPLAPARRPVVRHLRVLVQAGADAVAHELAHHRVAVRLGVASAPRGRCRPPACPDGSCAMPACSASSVTRIRRSASALTFPTPPCARSRRRSRPPRSPGRGRRCRRP